MSRHDDTLVTVSQDKTEFWNGMWGTCAGGRGNGEQWYRKCSKTILAHEGPVWAMSRHEDTLVTVSQDKIVSFGGGGGAGILRAGYPGGRGIGKCSKTFLAHEGPVWAMSRHEDTLDMVSQDKTVSS